jgi:hypothetical protein
MAEVLVQFDPPLIDSTGRVYIVKICGRPAEDGLWEGWIEFHPQDGGIPLRTPRETEQPNRRDLDYWATGLTVSYLEGALDRALDPETPDLRPKVVAGTPAYDTPAPSSPTPAVGGRPKIRPHGVLNPFEVYAQGEDVLREELGALDEGHLRNIIREHGLVQEEEVDLLSMQQVALADLIVAGVRRRAG